MKKIIFCFIFLIFIINFVSASLETDINVHDSFSLGEESFFNYSFISDTVIEVVFMPHIMCPNAPVAPYKAETIQLQANEEYSATYEDQVIDEYFKPQTCEAYIQILNPTQEQKTVSKNFNIYTAPSFEFDIVLFETIFIQGENIEIDFTSDVSELEISANLVYPSGEEKDIELPYLKRASEIGTYDLVISATKEGYKDFSLNEQFAVIEKHSKIGDNQTREYNLLPIILGISIIVLLLIVLAYFGCKEERETDYFFN